MDFSYRRPNTRTLRSWLLATCLAVASCLSSAPSLSDRLSGKMILAPLTKAGNLPFRRLCTDFGMEISMSEMIYARSLLRKDPIERARMRRAPNERFFGVQIATNQVEEGVKAMELAAESGADFVDLNCGCPIFEATRRGLGSALLRTPEKLGRLVGGMVEKADGIGIPLSVKIRLGCEADSVNVREVVQELRDAGAKAVTVHGRTARQGYSKPADWELIREVVEDGIGSGVPIVGNGDILTYYEAQRRINESGVSAVMVGRGALTKPWIFQEYDRGETWNPTVTDRIAIYRTLTSYMKDHFGDDEMGRKKSWNFLPYHFEFFSRYVPYSEEEYGELSMEKPLLQERIVVPDDVSPLETLLYHRNNMVHDLIASALWDSDSDTDAVLKLTAVAEGPKFKEIHANPLGNEDAETEELANVPKSSKRRNFHRRGRKPKPKRTPEEIVAIRAERAEKKARLAAEAKAAKMSI